MSRQMFEIGVDKLERLHAEAADRRDVRRARSVRWAEIVRWIGDRCNRS